MHDRETLAILGLALPLVLSTASQSLGLQINASAVLLRSVRGRRLTLARRIAGENTGLAILEYAAAARASS